MGMFKRTYDKKRKALIDLLLTQAFRSGPTNAIILTLIAFVVWPSRDSELIIVWLICGYVISLSRYQIVKLVRSFSSKENLYKHLESTLVIILFISGLFWGITAWIFIDPENFNVFVFVSLAIVSIPPSALAAFSALPYIWFLFSATMISVITIKLLTIGLWELAVLSVLSLIGLTPFSINLGRTIEKSITLDLENSALLEQAQTAKDKAEQANIVKSKFLAAASHDLRQPLHAQGILLEALRLRLKGGEHEKLLDKTIQSNEVLNSLFSTLLEISRLDAGTIMVNRNTIDVYDTCQSVIDQHQMIAEQKGLSLKLSGEHFAVSTDPVLLGRILRNLVNNAIKFTPQGQVDVNITAQDEHVYIEVCDTGIGIADDLQAHIFDEYFQIDNPVRDRNKGIGLGLALVRRMCELLGHEITLQSQTNQGSTFRLSLPKGDSANIESTEVEGPSVSLEGLKILMIDDEVAVLEAMTLMLNDWNCHPEPCQNLQQAEALLKQQTFKPDLIISDYRLAKDITGLDVVTRLQQLTDKPTPAIIISGDTDPALLKSIHQQGFYLLHKPIKSAKLKKVFRILLREQS